MTPPTRLRFGTCSLQRKHSQIVTDRRGHDPALRSAKQQFTGILTADMHISYFNLYFFALPLPVASIMLYSIISTSSEACFHYTQNFHFIKSEKSENSLCK